MLLDHKLDATEIYEAPRTAVVAALTARGSRARNERSKPAKAAEVQAKVDAYHEDLMQQ